MVLTAIFAVVGHLFVITIIDTSETETMQSVSEFRRTCDISVRLA